MSFLPVAVHSTSLAKLPLSTFLHPPCCVPHRAILRALGCAHHEHEATEQELEKEDNEHEDEAEKEGRKRMEK
jgi:hypothetical protein